MLRSLFNHLPPEGQVNYSKVLAIVNKPALRIHAQISV